MPGCLLRCLSIYSDSGNARDPYPSFRKGQTLIGCFAFPAFFSALRNESAEMPLAARYTDRKAMKAQPTFQHAFLKAFPLGRGGNFHSAAVQA